MKGTRKVVTYQSEGFMIFEHIAWDKPHICLILNNYFVNYLRMSKNTGHNLLFRNIPQGFSSVEKSFMTGAFKIYLQLDISRVLWCTKRPHIFILGHYVNALYHRRECAVVVVKRALLHGKYLDFAFKYECCYSHR